MPPANRRQGSRDLPPPPPSPDRLAATLVRYDHRPDRLTVHPAASDEIVRMSTWLTADADAFVDLAAVR